MPSFPFVEEIVAVCEAMVAFMLGVDRDGGDLLQSSGSRDML